MSTDLNIVMFYKNQLVKISKQVEIIENERY